METLENSESIVTTAIEKAKVSEDTKVQLREMFLPFEIQAKEWSDKAFGIVVTDISQTDIIEQAKEGAKFLQQVRLGVEKLHKEKKADVLPYSQMLDLIKRTLNGLIEPAESHLKEQAEFAKNFEIKQKEQLRASRLELLKPYRMEGDRLEDFPLEEMAEPAFANLLRNQRAGFELAAKEKKEEDDRKADEQKKTARVDARTKLLSGIGFRYVAFGSGAQWSHEGTKLFMNVSELETLEDEQFDFNFQNFTAAVEKYEEVQKSERDKQTRLTNRLNALLGLGFLLDHAKKIYSHPKAVIEISEEDLKNVSADDFRARYVDFQQKIKAIHDGEKLLEGRIQKLIDNGFNWDGNTYGIADFKRLDKQTIWDLSEADFEFVVSAGAAEVKRLADIEKNKRELAVAPDKAKLFHYADTLQQNQPLNVTDPAAHAIMTRAVLMVEEAIAFIRREAEKL
jgi:hypothetical protein